MKQLRKSDLFVENKTVRFGDDPKKATVLNFALMKQRCDVDGFLGAQIEPLRGSGCNL